MLYYSMDKLGMLLVKNDIMYSKLNDCFKNNYYK